MKLLKLPPLRFVGLSAAGFPECRSLSPNRRPYSNDVPSGDNLLYTAEHFALRAALKKIIDKHINPFVDKWEEEGQFTAHQVLKILGKAGFLGTDKPTEYGGLGLDFSYSTAVAEELERVRCGGVPMAIGVQASMATPALTRFGSDEPKKEFLAPTIAGDIVACIGVSETGAGSDVASVHIAKKIDKLGMRSSDTAEIFFENVRILSKYLIGEEGMGFIYQMLQFQEERMWGVASLLVTLENLIKRTIDYTSQRKAFGQPVLHNQTVHFHLAELATEMELLRSLLYRAVGLYIRGNDVTKFAAVAKLKLGRLG
ncbi:probable acyl-CoA dehydrogenase 6 isoform X2 [Candoia aspera]|uniref:probable acyl-CoA dehydrogenase 6 isoform X2 n=1 Tax=Candoia aspera TaxID=51853 RepID=UPI002FD870A6